ncbi:hypothetical protein PIB30_093874, partial [Stylosanthes scabra]|nr:hypothetical protein [Stylosanthes scabra]
AVVVVNEGNGVDAVDDGPPLAMLLSRRSGPPFADALPLYAMLEMLLYTGIPLNNDILKCEDFLALLLQLLPLILEALRQVVDFFLKSTFVGPAGVLVAEAEEPPKLEERRDIEKNPPTP